MSINAQYQEDKDLISELCPNELDRFEQWFAQLNIENIKRGNLYGGSSLEESTGVKCWFDFFTDGCTPAEAIDEDSSYAS